MIEPGTECKRHLLACFGDGVDFVVGLEDGAILDVDELEAVMKLARLVWVQSVRSTGKPLAMEKVPGLDSYFAKLGSGSFDIAKFENDEDAADDLDAETRSSACRLAFASSSLLRSYNQGRRQRAFASPSSDVGCPDKSG
jgi:hypothetical protein